MPLKLKQWSLKLGITNITELDWQESIKFGEWEVHAVPVQHWSALTPFDRNKSLWAGWVLETEGFRFFFAGETGYSKDFKILGEKGDVVTDDEYYLNSGQDLQIYKVSNVLWLLVKDLNNESRIDFKEILDLLEKEE